ncbi:phosphatidylserine decarboxylase family protein [Kineococcus rhizosphaerae]|uniref:Phosphatidylserine decarboxylase n=1 Tax=Kineococcus rhizosphaerae TaxID=559628 RepID=A0A2T0QZD3_9ACTN|nr:phosphatidylserine decarboxylase family protein [Kineococcus rhizosphaerae]PRY12056.1 phosphatidylserine decarboxylase [Kineococcus rhizosphaerae]
MTLRSGSDPRRRGGWLPDPESVAAWVEDLLRNVAVAGDDVPRHPAIRAFEDLVQRDALVRMRLERMIAEVPQGPGHPARHLNDVPEMLRLLNAVLTTAPEFSPDSMVMTPVQAVLDQTTATPSGFAAYRDPTVNAALGEVLRAWCEHLDSPASLSVLDDSEAGWMSQAAAEAIGIEQYQHDPDDEHWGFTSWNDFFTRRFREGERPVEAPDDDKVVVSACESTPYALVHGVQRQDRFWLKTQPYSLQDVFAGDPAVEEFVGGTVYQAFLSATDYHRWHAPVSGTVERAFVVGGTYFSDADTEGADAAVPQDSQGYMAHVAARAVILIRAHDPVLGLVGFVPVGMADVSSCLIDEAVVPGARVEKGDELGRF